MGSCRVLVLLLIAGVLCAPPLAAETIRVVAGQSIQAAIDGAAEGDVIVVGKGTYDEPLVIDGRTDLRLRAKGAVILRTLTISNSTGIEVFKLRLADSRGHGVYVVDSTVIRLDRLRISGTAGDGVRVDGSESVVVERCRIDDVGGHGVALSAGLPKGRTDLSSVLRNRITRPTLDGVAVQGDENLVERNRVMAPGRNGIELQADNAEISGNLVLKNRVLAPFDTGLVTGGTANVFRQNRVIDARLTGARIRGAGNTFERNRFVRILGDIDEQTGFPIGGSGIDAEDGVLAEGQPVGHVLVRNVVIEAANDAFLLSVTGALAERNVARSPGSNGFTVVLTDNVLIKNRCTKAGLTGFKIYGAGFHIIDGNRATRNQAAGFLVTSSHNLFQNNRATKNLPDVSDIGAINCYRDNNSFKFTCPETLVSDCSDWDP